MAADPTIDDTDGAADDGARSSASLITAAPPRPPRPAKRASSPRIPMPMPMPSSPESAHGGRDEFDEFDAAPPRDAGRDNDIPSAPPAEVKPRSAALTPVPSEPPTSYGDEDDHAPPAPLTPWRAVPPLVTRPLEADSSPPVGIDETEEREDTIVGEVPKNLLDMSTSNDDCTRAYTAPQELIELAKRKREERKLARQPSRMESAAPPVPDPSSIVTERPPAMKRREEAARLAESVRDGQLQLHGALQGSAGDSAPPVQRARSNSDAARDTVRPRSSSPQLEVSPASSLDDQELEAAARAIVNQSAPAREMVPESAVSLSSYKTPWLTPGRRFMFVALAFIVLGFILARSNRVLDLIFR